MNNATNNIAAANTNAVIASMMVATGVLCRWDGEKNKPVVFNTNKMEGGMIESWISGDPEMVPLSYYHTTLPLASADEKLLAARYAKATGDKNVQIRHRLPRTVKEVPNRIAKTPLIKLQDLPEAAPAPVVAPVVETTAPAPVVEPVAATPAPAVAAKTPASRKPAAKPKRNRGGSRKSAAKPIGDVAPAPAAAPLVAPEANIQLRRASDRADPANLESRVEQLADVVAKLAEIVGAKVIA